MPYAREVHKTLDVDPGVGLHVPDHVPERRLLGSRPQAVGGARAHGVPRSCPRCRRRLARDPRHPDLPDPAAGAARRRHSSRSRSCSPRPPSLPRSWASPRSSRRRRPRAGMFAFPPLIDVKIDQPAVGDRARPRQGGGARARPPDRGAGPRRRGRRELREPLQRRRPQLQGHPAAPARGAPEPGAARGHPRHRPERPARRARLHRDDPRQRRAALAEPLPAAQRREAQRRRDPPARQALDVPRGRGCEDPAAGLRASTTRASRASSAPRATSSCRRSCSRWS